MDRQEFQRESISFKNSYAYQEGFKDGYNKAMEVYLEELTKLRANSVEPITIKITEDNKAFIEKLLNDKGLLKERK